MAEPVIQLKNIAKTYPSEANSTIKALYNLDITVHEGEFISIIGPTGCGKTTLLNIIAGLDVPDDGEIRLSDDLKQKEHIPLVFQHYTLFPWRKLLRNITFGLEMNKTPRKERLRIAADVLNKVGLSGFEHAYPHELSGGMRQRAAIAQTLAVQPRLMLMDEPFGALDDSSRTELQNMITRLWKEANLTVLFVTHNIDEAIAIADRIIVLSDRPGRIIKEYTVKLPRPRDRISKAFTDLFVEVRQSLSSGIMS
jgi:NitT/TauT family transport system ATP-binding protein